MAEEGVSQPGNPEWYEWGFDVKKLKLPTIRQFLDDNDIPHDGSTRDVVQLTLERHLVENANPGGPWDGKPQAFSMDKSYYTNIPKVRAALIYWGLSPPHDAKRSTLDQMFMEHKDWAREQFGLPPFTLEQDSPPGTGSGNSSVNAASANTNLRNTTSSSHGGAPPNRAVHAKPIHPLPPTAPGGGGVSPHSKTPKRSNQPPASHNSTGHSSASTTPAADIPPKRRGGRPPGSRGANNSSQFDAHPDATAGRPGTRSTTIKTGTASPGSPRLFSKAPSASPLPQHTADDGDDVDDVDEPAVSKDADAVDDDQYVANFLAMLEAHVTAGGHLPKTGVGLLPYTFDIVFQSIGLIYEESYTEAAEKLEAMAIMLRAIKPGQNFIYPHDIQQMFKQATKRAR